MNGAAARPLLASIGTTHPWNIAGVGLDARVAAELQCAHAAVIVAVSAQDAHGVHAIAPLDEALVQAQFDALPPDVRAYRIGALVSSANAHLVARILRERARETPVVLDPVLEASLGGSLSADPLLPQALLDELIAYGAVVTPNVREASTLLGMPVESEAAMRAAAEAFVARGARGAVITGGHLPGDPVDVVREGRQTIVLHDTRLSGELRGGGCVFAAALACELAGGVPLLVAAQRAKTFVRERMQRKLFFEGLQVAF